MAKGSIEADSDTAVTRRGRPRSAETTNAILQSAYKLMATTGLAATSIDAVARHSNVSKMTIYKWWPSREALLIDAFLDHASAMLPLCGGGDQFDQRRSSVAEIALVEDLCRPCVRDAFGDHRELHPAELAQQRLGISRGVASQAFRRRA